MPPRSADAESFADLAQRLVAAHEYEVKALLQRVHDLEQRRSRRASDDVPLVPLESYDIPSPARRCMFTREKCDDALSRSEPTTDEGIVPDVVEADVSVAQTTDAAMENWRRMTLSMLSLSQHDGSYTLRTEFLQESISRTRSTAHYEPEQDAVLAVLAQHASRMSRPSFDLDEFLESEDDENGCWLCRFVTLLMIYPYSNVRLAWVLSGFGILLFDLVDLSLEAFRHVDSEAKLDFMRWIVLSFWCTDVIMSFLTGVAVNERLEMRPGRVASIYLRSWFAFDVLVLLPDIMDVVLQDLTNAFGFLKHVKIVRYLRLLRMIRLAKIRYLMKTLDAKVNSIVLLLTIRMCGATCCIVAWIHVSACFWYMAGSAEDSGWVNVESVNELSLLHRYLFSVQWAAAQFQGSTSIGSSNSMICLAVATCIIVLSVIFTATFFSRLTSIMHELLQLHNSRVQTMTKVKALITAHKISSQLSFVVQRFADLSMRIGESRTFGVRDHDNVLELLPIHLREQLTVEMLYPAVSKHVFVMAIRIESEVMFKKMLCKAMSERYFHHAESIFSMGEMATRVYMSLIGSLSYRPAPQNLFRKYGLELMKTVSSTCTPKRDGDPSIEVITRKNMAPRKTATLPGTSEQRRTGRLRVVPQGSLLAEAGVWVSWCHEGDLETVTEASMLHLNLFRFRELLGKFPGVTARLQENAERFVLALNDADQDAKDLLHSSEVIKKLCGSEQLHAMKRLESH